MSKNDRVLLMPIIALAIAVFSIILSYQFFLPAIAENQSKIEALNSDITSSEAKLASLTTANSEIAKLSDIVNKLLIAVPADVDSPNLITEIETIANQKQLALPSISPPVAVTSTDNSDAGLSVSISLSGQYQNTVDFINSLENSIRFSKIVGLSMSSTDSGEINTSIVFEIYKRSVSDASILEQSNSEVE